MLESIFLKEYEEKDIKNCNLDKLQAYLRCQKLDSVLKVTRNGIKAKSWVGIIKYKKTCFQIFPKLICDNDNEEKILKNLVFMLSYTKNLDIKTTDTLELSKEKNPFIEILIREYANSLFESLKRFSPKKYIRREENLNFLKGKLKFSENIKYNSINQTKFYCEYDKFCENNQLNQLFLFVSKCLFNISNNRFNKKMLKFIINYYSDIDFVRFDRFQTEKIKLLKNQEMFKKPFILAKMFIEKSSVDLIKDKFENITLIWDMNKLFEEFVFEIMKKAYPKLNIKSQKGKRLLKNDNSKRRNTFVDIFVEKDDEKIIIDTKYKKFLDINSCSNSDIFQISTYCLLYGSNSAILLYPQWNDTKPDIPAYFLNRENNQEKEYKIEFKTIDLKYDDLKNNIDKIMQEVLCIL